MTDPDTFDRWLGHPIVKVVREQYPDCDAAQFLRALSKYLGTLEDQFPGGDFDTILANGAEEMASGPSTWKPMTVNEHEAILEVQGGSSLYAAAKRHKSHPTRLDRLRQRLAS